MLVREAGLHLLCCVDSSPQRPPGLLGDVHRQCVRPGRGPCCSRWAPARPLLFVLCTQKAASLSPGVTGHLLPCKREVTFAVAKWVLLLVRD